jgi:hypothetical protein
VFLRLADGRGWVFERHPKSGAVICDEITDTAGERQVATNASSVDSASAPVSEPAPAPAPAFSPAPKHQAPPPSLPVQISPSAQTRQPLVMSISASQLKTQRGEEDEILRIVDLAALTESVAQSFVTAYTMGESVQMVSIYGGVYFTQAQVPQFVLTHWSCIGALIDQCVPQCVPLLGKRWDVGARCTRTCACASSHQKGP